MKDGKPVFVKGAGTGGGSMRSSLTIYKDEGTLQYLAGQVLIQTGKQSYQLRWEIKERMKKDFKRFSRGMNNEVLVFHLKKLILNK